MTFLAARKTKISVTHGKRICEVPEADEITLNEEDKDSLMLPRNDGLVIFLNYKIKSVLIDPGSSVNIIQLRVLEQAKLTNNIVLTTQVLDGFNLTSVTIQGEIVLPTYAEEVMKSTLFEVVHEYMGYNVILDRPWIYDMEVVPSTYHQLSNSQYRMESSRLEMTSLLLRK